MRKRLIILSLLVSSISNPALSASLDCADPKSFIKSAAGEITATLRDQLPLDKRNLTLARTFDQMIDIDFMSQYVLGHQWQSLTPSQQEEFKTAYRQYLSATYMREINGYTGKETVNVFDAKPVKGQMSSYIVAAQIVNAPNDTDDFSTLVLKNGNCYKIGDIIDDGVSLLNTERQDFTSTLKHQGFGQLISLLKDKSAQ